MPIGLKNAVKLQPAVQLTEKEFVKGFFDTDGCVYRKQGKYKQIQFKGSSETLIQYSREILERLGFHPSKLEIDETRYKFYLCRQNEVNLFFKTIDPVNETHLKRFANFS
jgi:intein-encoded DNA endonuclease-like protein